MSVGGEPGHLHPATTQRNRYRYFFYDKHHGRGGPEAAQWSPELSEAEEFAIFDQSDVLDLSDEQGNLYGLSIREEPERQVRYLGTRRQQIAKFPFSHPGAPWHGFPLGPLERTRDGPRPPIRALPQDALSKMVASGLIDGQQRRRLLKGKHI
jgi:hypothetical protein